MARPLLSSDALQRIAEQAPSPTHRLLRDFGQASKYGIIAGAMVYVGHDFLNDLPPVASFGIPSVGALIPIGLGLEGLLSMIGHGFDAALSYISEPDQDLRFYRGEILADPNPLERLRSVPVVAEQTLAQVPKDVRDAVFFVNGIPFDTVTYSLDGRVVYRRNGKVDCDLSEDNPLKSGDLYVQSTQEGVTLEAATTMPIRDFEEFRANQYFAAVVQYQRGALTSTKILPGVRADSIDKDPNAKRKRETQRTPVLAALPIGSF